MSVTLEKTPSNGDHKVCSGVFIARQGFQWWEWIKFGWIIDLGSSTEIANATYFKVNFFFFWNVFWKGQSANPFEIVLLYAERGAFIT